MNTYYFTKTTRKISEDNVRAIISEAGYDPDNYNYAEKVDRDGYVVTDVNARSPVMSTTVLRGAAKSLKIPVEISSPNDTEAVASQDSYSLTEEGAEFAGQPYQVDITMNTGTVNNLYDNDYSLYAFKAVQTKVPNGVPVVWFQYSEYSVNTSINWSVEYEAYTSRSAIIPGGKIVSSFNTPIQLNQTLVVDQKGGTGQVKAGGVPLAISIENSLVEKYTCGISQTVEGQSNPMCAFPLFGNGLDVIAPIQKVLLMFATESVNTGTVIYQAYSQGLLIDLTSANQRQVEFVMSDDFTGWKWNGGSWAQKVKANESLVPLLIEVPSFSPSFAQRRSLVHG